MGKIFRRHPHADPVTRLQFVAELAQRRAIPSYKH